MTAMDSLLDPQRPVSELAAFFSADYQQWVDGKTLDFDGFLQHARKLKSVLTEGKVTINRLLVSGDQAATRHDVEIMKRNGEAARVRVIALFSLRGDRITAVEELTYLLEGSQEDHHLGSQC
ncbi:hypothetical protein BTJ39_05610 [Izhakiella australiensis]|uniref:SnoaL-like domain-containing protein n=2 Tax=Izhakiella australiensis TaxID=1926881 RepID=A0A1S8YRH7_9GAMM|nr:hypothetical protein BTJ39_05610 [Izhakiella australiensis]